MDDEPLTPDQEFGRRHAELEMRFAEAMARDDIRAAFAAEQERCRLLGLYPHDPNPNDHAREG